MLSLTEAQLTAVALAEFEVCEKMSHPHVARYYSLIVEDGLVASVVELMSAGDLLSAITPNVGMPLEGSRAVLAGVCAGLTYLHTEHRLVHLDLKSENIFLSPGPIAKIGDFDAALPVGTAVARVRGTESIHPPEYFAPKKSQKDLQTIARSADVWAVGMLAYTMLLGKYAWTSTVPGRDPKYAAYLKTKELLPATAPEPLKELFQRTLSTDPALRPTTKQIQLFVETRWLPLCCIMRGVPKITMSAEENRKLITESAFAATPNLAEESDAIDSAAHTKAIGKASHSTAFNLATANAELAFLRKALAAANSMNSRRRTTSEGEVGHPDGGGSAVGPAAGDEHGSGAGGGGAAAAARHADKDAHPETLPTKLPSLRLFSRDVGDGDGDEDGDGLEGITDLPEAEPLHPEELPKEQLPKEQLTKELPTKELPTKELLTKDQSPTVPGKVVSTVAHENGNIEMAKRTKPLHLGKVDAWSCGACSFKCNGGTKCGMCENPRHGITVDQTLSPAVTPTIIRRQRSWKYTPTPFPEFDLSNLQLRKFKALKSKKKKASKKSGVSAGSGSETNSPTRPYLQSKDIVKDLCSCNFVIGSGSVCEKCGGARPSYHDPGSPPG